MSAWMCCLLTVTGPAVGAAPVTLGDDGVWRLNAPGLPAVSGSLFLWFASWDYETPQEVRREGDAVVGWLTAGHDNARVYFRAEAAEDQGRLRIRYTFRRDPGTQLTRGMLLLLTLPSEPLAGRMVRFSHSSAKPVETFFDGVGRNLSINLSDSQAFELAADRVVSFDRRSDSVEMVRVNVGLLPPDFPADADVPVTIVVGLTAAGSDRPSWEHSLHEPLALRVRQAPERVPVNSTATIDVDLRGTWSNPFDPNEVALDATITDPDGVELQLPGYFHQDYRALRADGVEFLEPVGAPGWRLRFTPTRPGAYRVELRARNAGQEVAAEPITVLSEASDRPGMIRIGPHRNVFVREGGGSLFLIGHNVPTYLSGRQSMAEALDKMAAGGENYNRFWMYSRHLGLEWDQPVGTYRLAEAWRLDNAFELCAERGIVILLCFDTHQDFIGDRFRSNPYHRERGGPIATPMEFFTSEEAKRLYRQRLRYIVARWAHCTNLVAWEFVNEIEGWNGYQANDENKQQVARWHEEMAAYLKSIDPYQHPVTTSCWTTVGHPSLWNAAGIDIVQSHHYANARVDMALRTAEICAQKRRDYPGRIHLFGEMGIDSRWSRGQGDDADPTGVHLHRQSWAALMSGCASVPANWWHESYFEPHDLYGVFRGIRAFADVVDLNRDWRPIEGLRCEWTERPEGLPPTDLEVSPASSGWDPIPEGTVHVLGRDGTVSEAALVPRLLHGQGHRDLRRPLVFDLDMREAGTFLVRVERCSNNPILVAHLDGRRVLERPFPTADGLGKQSVYREQWKIWETLYDEEVAVPVPAGPHRLSLDNEGGDWLTIGAMRLPGYVTDYPTPFAAAMGMTDGREAMLWVCNTRWWWWPVARGDAIPPVPAFSVILSGLPAGSYELEQWNTVSGRIDRRTEVTVTGAARIEIPQLPTDVAFRLRPVGG